MKQKIATTEQFFTIGCGRCDKGGTPECKVHTWPNELQALRKLALSMGLVEELKWSQPCYTYNGTNVILVSAFKDAAVVSFFRGSLLKDEENILLKPGENSNVARVIRFTDVKSINKLKPTLKAYITEAIGLVKAGKKVIKQPADFTLPEELIQLLDEKPEVSEAFHELTPGRQRSFVLHISGAKQASTRVSRAEKCIPKIMAGIGFNEYKK